MRPLTTFANVPASEYAYLSRKLVDERRSLQYHCTLPAGCEPDRARLVFFHQDGRYGLCFAEPVAYTGQNASVRALCDAAPLSFDTLEDLQRFLSGIALPGTQGSGTPARRAPHTEAEEPPAFVEIDAHRLLESLRARVHGQAAHLPAICGLVSAYARKRSPVRPLSLLLAGPTGIGKTLLAKLLPDALNAQLPEARYGFIRVNLNEYPAAFDVSKLLGAPPGYVGHGDDTILAPIARNPYQVILFDEMDKAHPDVLRTLMTAVDEGEMMLSRPVGGVHTLQLRRCILIFTTNLLAGDGRKGMEGDVAAVEDAAGTQATAAVRNMTVAARQYARDLDHRDRLALAGMRPEIAARFHSVFLLDPLDAEAIAAIARQEISLLAAQYDLTVGTVSDAILHALCAGVSTRFGVRMLSYAIERSLGLLFALYDGAVRRVSVCGTLEAAVVAGERAGDDDAGGGDTGLSPAEN